MADAEPPPVETAESRKWSGRSRSSNAGRRRSSLFEVQRFVRDRGSSTLTAILSNNNLAKKAPRVQYENTYKMQPDNKIDMLKVKDIIRDVLEDRFSDVKYNPLEAGQLCKRAAAIIRDEVKFLEVDRYKIVCTVSLSQVSGQGEKRASRYLWDEKKDNWVDGIFTSPYLTAHATVYMLYYE